MKLLSILPFDDVLSYIGKVDWRWLELVYETSSKDSTVDLKEAKKYYFQFVNF